MIGSTVVPVGYELAQAAMAGDEEYSEEDIEPEQRGAIDDLLDTTDDEKDDPRKKKGSALAIMPSQKGGPTRWLI